MPGITVEIRRLLLAHLMQPLPGNRALVEALQRHGEAVFGEPDPDVRHAAVHRRALLLRARHPGGDLRRRAAHVVRVQRQRADEHIVLEDLRRATKVVARTLFDLLQ